MQGVRNAECAHEKSQTKPAHSHTSPSYLLKNDSSPSRMYNAMRPVNFSHLRSSGWM